jgi:hypothetical protein
MNPEREGERERGRKLRPWEWRRSSGWDGEEKERRPLKERYEKLHNFCSACFVI